MAGLLERAPDQVEREINVLPLIDVLLVLIIICFLMQRWLVFIPAQLPPPARERPQAPVSGGQIVLEIRPDGSYRINGQPVPDALLEEQLRAIYAVRPTRLLFIKVAGERPYQEMVRAMDRARAAGVEVIGWVPR